MFLIDCENLKIIFKLLKFKNIFNGGQKVFKNIQYNLVGKKKTKKRTKNEEKAKDEELEE